MAELASRYSAVVVLENLNHLGDNAKKNNSFNKRLSLWFYRGIRFTVDYEVLERGFPVVSANPRRSSSKFPRCGGKLRGSGNRVLYCTKCSFVSDRDVVACVNLFLRYTICGGLGLPPNAPKDDASPRPM